MVLTLTPHPHPQGGFLNNKDISKSGDLLDKDLCWISLSSLGTPRLVAGVSASLLQ